MNIEAQESNRRHEVENVILQREVDKLRMDLNSTSIPAQQHYSAMANYEASDTAEKYRRRLVRAKRRLRDALGRIEDQAVEINRLKGHLPQEPPNSAADPTSRRYSRRRARHRGKNEEGALAALGILASQVLSQQQLDESESREGSLAGSTVGSLAPSLAGSLPASPVRKANSVRVHDVTVASSISEAQRQRMTGHRPVHISHDHDSGDTDVETGDAETEMEDEDKMLTALHTKSTVDSENDSATEPIVDALDVANHADIPEAPHIADMSKTSHFDPDRTLDAPSSPSDVAGFKSVNDTSVSAGQKRSRRDSSASTVSNASRDGVQEASKMEQSPEKVLM